VMMQQENSRTWHCRERFDPRVGHAAAARRIFHALVIRTVSANWRTCGLFY
jgi:hypothetical protein